MPQFQQPGFYSQPTEGRPIQPPAKPPKRKTSPLARKIGIGAGIIFFIIFTANAFSAHNSPATQPTPTAAPTATQAAVANIPTPKPTIRPTPKPTAKPTVHTILPTPRPTQPLPPPKPTPTPCVAVNNNPWCYNFNSGNLIYSPPSAFCQYFDCVSTFWTDTKGYVAECGNGKYTHSDGVSGACSRDGGVLRILYSH